MFSNPRDEDYDPWLYGLKCIALNGGDRGPLYDRGMLDVIEEVERTGGYTPSPLLALIDLPKQPGHLWLTPDIRAELEAELRRRGWTVEQGAEYARGVWHAERDFKRYRRAA